MRNSKHLFFLLIRLFMYFKCFKTRSVFVPFNVRDIGNFLTTPVHLKINTSSSSYILEVLLSNMHSSRLLGL